MNSLSLIYAIWTVKAKEYAVAFATITAHLMTSSKGGGEGTFVSPFHNTVATVLKHAYEAE